MQLKQSINEIVGKPFLSLMTGVVLLVPLVMSNGTNELFEFPKMFFVYFMGIGLLAFFLTSFVLRKEKVFWPSVPVLIFLAVNILSTVLSSHQYTSFWGYYTRFNDGLLSILIFVGIYFVCKNKLPRPEYIRLMKFAGITIFPIGLIGIMQHFGWGTVFVERVYSTFGQPNWLAQYLVMILPFLLYIFVTELSIIWGFLFVVGFSCLWFTYSMSGIAGFLVVTAVFLGVLLFKKLLSRSVFLRFLGIYLVCFIIAISNLGLFKGKVDDAFKSLNMTKEISQEVVAKPEKNLDVALQDTGYKVSDPGFIRLGLWKGSANLFLSSPKVFLLGTGPETFPYAFQPFRSKSLNFSSEWDFVFNKPHNYYLEILTEIGLLGFLSYMFLIFILFRKLPFYMWPGLIGFVVTNAFGWPVVSTALLFWIWLSWPESKK